MSDPTTGPTTGAAGESLAAAHQQLRARLLDADQLVAAVASGRRGGTPRFRRAELRYVDLKTGRHLQVTTYDQTQAHTANHRPGAEADTAVDELLAEPFGHWRVETRTEVVQLRVTKRLRPALRSTPKSDAAGSPRDSVTHAHDRDKQRLLPADAPVLVALGISTSEGRVKPSRQAKYRQVEEFVRLLDVAVGEAMASGRLRQPTADEPLRVVDLGCGNAYLTFAAHRYLSGVRGLPVHLTGVDTKQQSRDHNALVAAGLGADLDFVVAGIVDVELDPPPEVVLALHACDTATDDALARAVGWRAPLVLAAPCCHHDLAAQLRRTPPASPYTELLRHGILRERLADTLTDALRASLLRSSGYRVDVVEFVASAHTPRNTMLRAVRVGDPHSEAAVRARAEYDDLVAAWRVSPRLGALLDHGR